MEMTRKVKKAAKLYGASLVGVAAYNPLWMQMNKRYDLTPLEMPEESKVRHRGRDRDG